MNTRSYSIKTSFKEFKMSTTYGKNIKITVYGGSHQECIGVRATGLPEGFAVPEGRE